VLAKFFIDRPIFAWVIAIVILLSGVLALRGLPVSSYPAVAPPALSITLTYPGASAQAVEETAVSLWSWSSTASTTCSTWSPPPNWGAAPSR
jgi:multidrug efflux pump